MYLDDYQKKIHHKKFKHVMNELESHPRAQVTRRDTRKLARDNPNILYSDSSDSEDDSKYPSGGVTRRSLLHTPTRMKKLNARQ